MVSRICSAEHGLSLITTGSICIVVSLTKDYPNASTAKLKVSVFMASRAFCDSLYWESWRNCPAPRGSPLLPRAVWAWRGAARGVSGCAGKQTVSRQHRGRHRTPRSYGHFVQEEIPAASVPPPPGAARSRTHEDTNTCMVIMSTHTYSIC